MSDIVKCSVKIPRRLSKDTKSLLKGLLTKDPAKRLSDPATIKGHKFFADVDWNTMAEKASTVL